MGAPLALPVVGEFSQVTTQVRDRAAAQSMRLGELPRLAKPPSVCCVEAATAAHELAPPTSVVAGRTEAGSLGPDRRKQAGEWRQAVQPGCTLSPLNLGAFALGVLRYRETVFPAILVITAAGLKTRQNFLWSASIYVALLLLGGFITFHRYVL